MLKISFLIEKEIKYNKNSVINVLLNFIHYILKINELRLDFTTKCLKFYLISVFKFRD